MIMFRRPRKKPPPARTPGWEDVGTDLPETGVERERRRLLQTWRRSEQRVMRTWQAWLAAAAVDQAERHRAYLRALAEEERAAIAVQSACRSMPTPTCQAAMPDVAGSPPR